VWHFVICANLWISPKLLDKSATSFLQRWNLLKKTVENCDFPFFPQQDPRSKFRLIVLFKKFQPREILSTIFSVNQPQRTQQNYIFKPWKQLLKQQGPNQISREDTIRISKDSKFPTRNQYFPIFHLRQVKRQFFWKFWDDVRDCMSGTYTTPQSFKESLNKKLLRL
jgi:hypothetical protein